MAYDLDKAVKAQAKLEGILAAVFRDAAVGCGADENGAECLDVFLRREPTDKQRASLPQDVDGVRVRYIVTGPSRAF